MNTVQVDDLERPYVENNTLYVPSDCQMGSALAVRWLVITEVPVISVIRIKWEADTSKSWTQDIGWATEWVFFADGNEVEWDSILNKTAIAREFRGRHWVPQPNDAIPWGEDIETLLALESA